MKPTLFYLAFVLSSFLIAQNNPSKSIAPEPFFHPFQAENTECITEAQRELVRNEITLNRRAILEKNPSAFQFRSGHPLFIMPLRAKAGFNDYGYYIINNQVDHDLVPNNHLLDYNCGERTYDWGNGNHAGTDYVLWPYPWKRMQEEVMEVVAAAPGVIVNKRDGYYDLNCVNAGNPNWNGIVLEHADGSQSWYWHFKNGAITSKNIGDSVAEGEYLGAAGSSGSSTIPHLHFEVHDSNGALIDPYQGPCNNMNPDSWFAEQPAYMVPEINRLSTHYSTAFDTDCPEVENTYEELNFLPGQHVIFRIFYRDISTGDDTHIVLKKPDGSVLYDYVFTSPWPAYTGAYAEWDWIVDSNWPDGVYTITATFGGKTYQTIFGVNTNLGMEDLKAQEFSIYPNPTSEVLNIEGSTIIEQVVVYDLLGREIMEISPMATNTQLNLTDLNVGVYFLTITSEGKRTTKKIVKE